MCALDWILLNGTLFMWNSCLFISTLGFAKWHTDGYSTLNIVQEDKQQTYFQSQQEGQCFMSLDQNSLEMCFSLLRVSSPCLWTTCANPQQFLQWCPEPRVPQQNVPAMPPKCSRFKKKNLSACTVHYNTRHRRFETTDKVINLCVHA